jgi:hypothetical protein
MFQIVASLTDDTRGVIYDRNMFIAQASGLPLALRNKEKTLKTMQPSGRLLVLKISDSHKLVLVILGPVL